MQDLSAGRSRPLEGSLQAHRGREGVARLESVVQAWHSDSCDTSLHQSGPARIWTVTPTTSSRPTWPLATDPVGVSRTQAPGDALNCRCECGQIVGLATESLLDDRLRMMVPAARPAGNAGGKAVIGGSGGDRHGNREPAHPYGPPGSVRRDADRNDLTNPEGRPSGQHSRAQPAEYVRIEHVDRRAVGADR